MNTKIIIGVVIVVLLALGLWWWQSRNVPASLEGVQIQESSDTVEVIQQDLDSLDLGDLDMEFKEIDSSTNQL